MRPLRETARTRINQACVQAVVSDSGPIDLVEQYRGGVLREVCTRFMGGPPEGERAAAYQRASPANWIAPRNAAPAL